MPYTPVETIAHRARAVVETQFVRAAAGDLAKLEAIARDPKLTDDGRAELMTPLRAKLRERHAEVTRTVRELTDEARSDYVARLPAEMERAAAFLKPERVTEIRALTAGVPAAELPAIVELVVAAKDGAAAFALRHVLSERVTAGDDVDASLFAALNVATADGREVALATLVAAQHVSTQLQLLGPQNDFSVVTVDPTAALNANHRASTVPTDARGATTILPTSEVARLMAIIRLPREAPGDRSSIPGPVTTAPPEFSEELIQPSTLLSRSNAVHEHQEER